MNKMATQSNVILPPVKKPKFKYYITAYEKDYHHDCCISGEIEIPEEILEAFPLPCQGEYSGLDVTMEELMEQLNDFRK